MAMVLRSIYLDPKLDAELAGRAEVEGTTKAELMRRFLVAGLVRPAAAFSAYAAETDDLFPAERAEEVAASEPDLDFIETAFGTSTAHKDMGSRVADTAVQSPRVAPAVPVTYFLRQPAPAGTALPRGAAAHPARVARGTDVPSNARPELPRAEGTARTRGGAAAPAAMKRARVAAPRKRRGS